MSYLDVVERSWPLLGRLMKGHALAYRATHGLVGHRFPGLPPMRESGEEQVPAERRRGTCSRRNEVVLA